MEGLVPGAGGISPTGPIPSPTVAVPSGTVKNWFIDQAESLATAAAKAAAYKFNQTMAINAESGNCPLPTPIEPVYTVPLVGWLNFYDLNVVISAFSCLFAFFIITVLMWQHCNNLTKPHEQIHILRICAFIPIYAVGTIIMVVWPNAYPWLDPWLVVVEGVTIAYFFLLMSWFLIPEIPGLNANNATPKDVYCALQINGNLQKDLPITTKSGRFCRRYFLIMQCPVTLFLRAILVDITQATGSYCIAPGGPAAAETVLSVIEIVSMITAVISVIRSYSPNKRELQPHRTMAKLWAFKLIVGLQILQNIIYLILERIPNSPMEPTIELSYVDLNIGIPNLIIALELVIFAVFFHYAYSAVPYYPDSRTSPLVPKPAGEQKIVVQMSFVQGVVLFLDPRELIGAILFVFKISKAIRAAEADRAHGSRFSDKNLLSSSQSPPPHGHGGPSSSMDMGYQGSGGNYQMGNYQQEEGQGQFQQAHLHQQQANYPTGNYQAGY